RWSPCRPVRRDSWPSHDRDVTSSSRALATMASTSAGHAHVIEKSFSRSEAPLSSLGAVNPTFRGDMPMSQVTSMQRAAAVLVFSLIVVLQAAGVACADPTLIAIGSISGTYEDFATETAALLENGVPGNRLGGMGSGLAYAGGNTFLALPDRGPNAKMFNSAVDDTASYIARFQTLNLSLAPSDPG